MKKKLFPCFILLFLILLHCTSLKNTYAASDFVYLTPGKTYNYDVTNDGKKDKILMKKTMYGDFDGASGRIDIYVNNKKSYSLAAKNLGDAELYLFRISSKFQLLNLKLYHYYDHQLITDRIMSYKKNKFSASVDITKDVLRKNTSYPFDLTTYPVKVSKNYIRFNGYANIPGVGHNAFTIQYNISGNKLKLSRVSFPLDYKTWEHPYRGTENSWFAARSFTAYSSTNKGKKVFSTKTGEECKVESFIVKDNSVWIKVYNNKNKSGWVKCPTHALFFEAF